MALPTAAASPPSSLRAYRLTMEMKCADLDPAQLARRSVPPSAMSLLGLIRHMADVERNWFRRVMAQADAPPLYWSGDLADADWAGAVADPAVVDDAWQAWRDEVAFAEKFVAGSPDLGIRGTMRDGDTIALREVLVQRCSLLDMRYPMLLFLVKAFSSVIWKLTSVGC